MPTSSITHDFIIKDKQSADRLIKAMLEPKHELPIPVRSVSGIEEITSLMDRWEASNDKSHKL